MDVWNQLAIYESRDSITRHYEKRHSKSLKSAKAEEIISQLAQGREFFRSAKDASYLVKPLLLYYGVISLSRGLILFLNHELRENSLKPSHGLMENDWRQILHSGNSRLGDITAEVTQGTFSELARVTHNIERVLLPNSNEQRQWSRLGTKEYPHKTKFNLKEILKRSPEIREIFEKTFHERTFCYGLSIKAHGSIGTVMDIYCDKDSLNASNIKEKFRVPIKATENFEEGHFYLSCIVSHFSEDELSSNLPPIFEGHLGYVTLPFDDGIKLSTLSRLYLLSYFLGILVRYYPTNWTQLVTRQKGDLIYPVLNAVVELVENKFPIKILEEIGGLDSEYPRKYAYIPSDFPLPY
ncbi:YaaC family protein [Paenibacillus sp. S-38]|uniref:YaaC family protein n=1 Tax=Paenibacillus sp. S-38 TaxID=3416710 RepID=UPI003CEC3F96